jgi:hypothetical protein
LQFLPSWGVLRSLVPASAPLEWGKSPDAFVNAAFYPRFVGDVTGDGLADLVGTDGAHLLVAASANVNPPLPPNAPSNPRIVATTPSSLTVAWNDTSTDERQFFVSYHKRNDYDNRIRVAVGANVTSYVIGSLASDTEYCVTVQSESIFGLSYADGFACAFTKPQPQNNGPFTTTISMQRQIIIEGPVPYVGSFSPGSGPGALILNINFPESFPILMVKPFHSTEECGNPDAVVVVSGDMTADQKKAIWGTSDLSIPSGGKLFFVGCSTSSQLLDFLSVNILWNPLP